MIKKIIACLTICFIITGIISPVFSDASALPQPNWSDPGISEIINISDLTGWMLNGGTYDVSTYTDAESFMNDYFAARTKTRLEGSDYVIKSSFGLEQQYYEIGDSAYSHPLDVNRVISSSFRDHSGYGRRLSNEVNDALLSSGNLYDTKIPLLSDVEFANFVGYNHDALRLYSESFQNTDPDPDPDPDPDFSFINFDSDFYISGTDVLFYGSNLPISISTSQYLSVSDKLNYTAVRGRTYNTSWSGTGNDYSSNYDFMLSPLVTFYINSNQDDSVTVIASNFQIPHIIPSFNPDTSTRFNGLSIYRSTSQWSNGNIGLYRTYNELTYNTDVNRLLGQQSSFAGLSTAINWIHSYFRHYNLYVDGVLWVLANDPVSPPSITPEFPDAVGGEDLPSTTWPISRPRAPYYTSVPGMLQAIEDAIQGDGELDIDDLKPYLTDANGDPIPDPIFDPEPIPIPVPDPVNPDIVPGLPILPVIPPDLPGYNGVSVLAEIINFTNQSLPTSLIVTFWGIVFGIVILGLIKILHK